jgi:ribosomal-protein-alanine N-acetyltransferase
MAVEDIQQVLEVDRESYTLPWPASAYRREILHNRSAQYIVLQEVTEDEENRRGPTEAEHRPRLPLPFFRWNRPNDDRQGRGGHIIGYAGMWLMVDEAHITTIAVRTARRGKGLGELLLASLIEAAIGTGARRVTLEVRVSNETAQRLYRKYGFHQEGLRRRYYSDNNEDAYIMTTDSIQDAGYRRTFESLVQALRDRLAREPDLAIEAPPLNHLKAREPVRDGD